MTESEVLVLVCIAIGLIFSAGVLAGCAVAGCLKPIFSFLAPLIFNPILTQLRRLPGYACLQSNGPDCFILGYIALCASGVFLYVYKVRWLWPTSDATKTTRLDYISYAIVALLWLALIYRIWLLYRQELPKQDEQAKNHLHPSSVRGAPAFEFLADDLEPGLQRPYLYGNQPEGQPHVQLVVAHPYAAPISLSEQQQHQQLQRPPSGAQQAIPVVMASPYPEGQPPPGRLQPAPSQQAPFASLPEGVPFVPPIAEGVVVL